MGADIEENFKYAPSRMRKFCFLCPYIYTLALVRWLRFIGSGYLWVPVTGFRNGTDGSGHGR